MVNIAIIEDNADMRDIIRDRVVKILEDLSEVKIFTFSGAEEFLRKIEDRGEIDILISDIEMPGINGLELGKRVNENYPDTRIIFLTSYSEYAAESYTIDAYQYILKIDMEKRLPFILKRLINTIKREKSLYRLVGTPMNQEVLHYKEIIYICKDKGAKYVRYITRKGTYKERITLEQLKKELQSGEFVLAERGYIININHISRMQGNMIYMDNGEQLVCSRARLKDVKEKINLHKRSL